MPVPSKAAQEAEAQERQDSGNAVDRSQTAEAIDVVDDGAAEFQPTQRPVDTSADLAPAPRAAPQVGSAYDNKRAEIIARWKTDRTATEAQATEDDAAELAALTTGIEPQPAAELEPEPAAEPAEPEAPAPAPVVAAAAAPAKHKLKVHGRDVELTIEEMAAHAQKALAAGDILEEAKQIKRDIEGLVTRSPAPRPGRAGDHTGEAPGGDHTAASGTQTEPPLEGTTSPDQDDVSRLIESMQFGDPTEARALFDKTIENRVSAKVAPAVEQALLEDRMRDEGARTAKVLEDFKGKHAEVAADPYADAVIQTKMLELQVQDLQAIGVDPNQIQTPSGVVSPGDIALAHRFYRAKGYRVRTPETMLETALDGYLKWKGVGTPAQADPSPAADPASRTAPRIEVDRGARRAAIPQTPTRTAAPARQPTAPAAPQQRDPSDVVAQMKLRTKGLPRRGGSNVPA